MNDNNKIISNNISQVISTSTTTRSKTTTTTPRSKTGTFLFGQSGFCAIYTEWLCCPLFGAMAEDVCKTVAFLAAYSDELVQLNKHTLEAPFVAYVRGIRACSLVSLDILCVSSDHNIHTEHFRMSTCHASRRTCFCDTKRLCVCTAHSS